MDAGKSFVSEEDPREQGPMALALALPVLAIALSAATALAAGSMPTKIINYRINVSCLGTESSEATYGTWDRDYIEVRGDFDYVKVYGGSDQVLGGGYVVTTYGGSGNDKLWGDSQQRFGGGWRTPDGDDWLVGEGGDDLWLFAKTLVEKLRAISDTLFGK